MEGAKSALKTLDKEVQQRLLTVVRPPRTAGFTLGHGERTWERGETDTDKRVGIAMLRDGLIDQNYDVRTVNPADGLMNEVPKGITVLAIIGPRDAVPARGVRVDQPLHRRRRPRADRARSREQDRHARGARSPQPDVQGRAAGQRGGVRTPGRPEDQRPRQPGDVDVLVAPVGLDADAAGAAGGGRAAGRGLDRRQEGPHLRDPGRLADQGALRRRSSTRTETSPSIPTSRSAPGSWPRPRSRRTRACS